MDNKITQLIKEKGITQDYLYKRVLSHPSTKINHLGSLKMISKKIDQQLRIDAVKKVVDHREYTDKHVLPGCCSKLMLTAFEYRSVCQKLHLLLSSWETTALKNNKVEIKLKPNGIQ